MPQLQFGQTKDEALAAAHYSKQADSLIYQRKYREAIVVLEQAIAINRTLEKWEDLASCYNKLSVGQIRARNFEAGKKAAEAALVITTKQPTSYLVEQANAYDNLGEYYDKASKHDKSLDYYQQALKVRIAVLPKDHKTLSESHLNVASAYFEKNNFNFSQAHLDSAFAILKHDERSYSLHIGRYYAIAGQLCQAEMKNKEAERFYKKAITAFTAQPYPDQLQLAKTYGNLGETYYLLWDYNKAIECIKTSLKIFLQEVGENDFGVANNYSVLARIYGRRGEHAKALVYNKKTISLNRNVYGEKDPKVGLAYAITGVTYSYIDDYEKQLKYFGIALAIFRENFGENHRWVATTYENIGRVYNRLGKYDLSLDNYKHAIKTGIEVFGADNLKTAHIYLNAADTYAAKGMDDRAMELYQKALAIQKTEYGEKHREVAQNYVAQGNFYKSLRDYKNALANYNKVLEMYDTEINHAMDAAFVDQEFNVLYKIIEALEGKAASSLLEYDRHGNVEDLGASNSAFEKADKMVEQMRKATTSYQDKITLAENNQTAATGAIKTSFLLHEAKGQVQDKEKAFYYSEKNRAAALQELLERSNAKITDGSFKDLMDAEKQLKRERAGYLSRINNEREGAEINTDKIAKYENELFGISKKHDSVLQIVKDRHPTYFAVENDNSLVTVSEIQTQLNPHATLIEYYYNDSSTYVFVFTKQSYEVRKLETFDLQDKIRQFKGSIIEKDLAVFKKIAYELYQLILDPIAEQLVGDELIVIPHGPLWYINFELLLTQQSESNNPKDLPYLLRSQAISYANSANTLFNFPRSKEKLKQECLAFSFSDVTKVAAENTLSMATLRDTGDDLPGTRKEIKAISEIVDGAYYFGAQALEANFKRIAGDYAIVHLALHGEVDHEHPENSKLYFTKARDTLEDNILYSHELFTMDIPAELAVLSACNTGSGKVTMGEGIMSIGNAFQFAGTRSLLMSSWQVSDQTTPELMNLFYSNLKSGMSKSKALQQAKLRYLENASGSRSNPFYWGSFYLVGDVAPIELGRSFNWIYLGFGLLALALILLTGYRRVKVNRKVATTR